MTLTELKKYWVAEWSTAQGCYNVTTLFQAIQNNRRMCIEKRNNDYQIFAIYETQQQATEACEEMRELQK
jgi:hypothetical protein